jgi:hypothetical protein
MDLMTAVNLVQGIQAQSLAQARLEATLKTVKDFQDFQADAVARLLASIPSVNPDGVGTRLDITV